MSQTDFLARIKEIAEQVCQREGCVLYDLEFGTGFGGRTLRVFVDKMESGVGVEDCANVSKGLNLLLDVEDVVPGGNYMLEVSTPGMDRRLTQPWHFKKSVGQEVKVKLHRALETFDVTHVKNRNTKNLRDVLLDADDQGITFSVTAAGGPAVIEDSGQVTFKVPFAEIERATLVPEYERGGKEKEQSNHKGNKKNKPEGFKKKIKELSL